MTFTQELPEWKASGTKPPQSKLDTGWQIGERPPSGWWNWMLNRTYKVVEELQLESIHVDQKGIANGVATLDATGKVPASQLNVQSPADASTTVKGIVMLEDSVTSTSVTKAATPKNIKAAYDVASAAIPTAQKGAVNGVAPLNANAKVAPSLIDQDANNRFVTDAEKLSYAAKASTAIATTSANGLMSSADKVKLDAGQLFKLTQDNGQLKSVGSAVNLSEVTSPGDYITGATHPDSPISGIAGKLTVSQSTTSISQEITFFSGGGSNVIKFLRNIISGTVTSWRKLTDTNLLGNVILGNKFVDQSNANFAGKVSGSTTANPNAFFEATDAGLGTITSPATELSDYVPIQTLNGTVKTTSILGNGLQAKHRAPFNLIAIMERTYGTIPGTTTADKVAWLKSNLSKLTFNWWGFGSSPAGNKATIQRWRADNSSWYTPLSNTSSNPAKIGIVGNTADISINIDSNGFVHFLAYADPSDGTTPSVIHTDYVELQIELSTDIKSNLNIATTADKITIADTANYYTATQVEGALAEVGQVLAGTRQSIVTTAQQLGVM